MEEEEWPDLVSRFLAAKPGRSTKSHETAQTETISASCVSWIGFQLLKSWIFSAVARFALTPAAIGHDCAVKFSSS
jgi:hypothetical protein